MISKKYLDPQVFKETEAYINNLSLKRCHPPFISNVFLPMRETSYRQYLKQNSNKGDEKTKLFSFIERFEIDYVEQLSSKLKGRYAEYIQQRNYNLPSDINFKQMRNLDSVDEMDQFSNAVAEWSLELEILLYTIEGLELYGIRNPKKNEQRDISNIAKSSFSSNRSSFSNMSEYLLRRMIGFILSKASNLAFLKGISKVGFGSQAIFQIFWVFSMTNRIPWTLIMNYLNLPWILGGLTCSLILSKLNSYIVQEKVASNLHQAYETFEKSKISIMNARKNLVDTALRLIEQTDPNKEKEERQKIEQIIENLLHPKEELDAQTGEDFDQIYDIIEVEDYVLVEEKDHQEKKDSTGFIVVDF